jgi:hypothetical protein
MAPKAFKPALTYRVRFALSFKPYALISIWHNTRPKKLMCTRNRFVLHTYFVLLAIVSDTFTR